MITVVIVVLSILAGIALGKVPLRSVRVGYRKLVGTYRAPGFHEITVEKNGKRTTFQATSIHDVPASHRMHARAGLQKIRDRELETLRYLDEFLKEKGQA